VGGAQHLGGRRGGGERGRQESAGREAHVDVEVGGLAVDEEVVERLQAAELVSAAGDRPARQHQRHARILLPRREIALVDDGEAHTCPPHAAWPRSRRNAGLLYTHRPSQGPCRCSALGMLWHSAAERASGRQTLQRSARQGSDPRGGGHGASPAPAARRRDQTETTGDLLAQMFTTMPAAEAQPWAGARRDAGSPVLAVVALGERLEPPLDLSDPPLELLDLTTRRPELLHDRLGQALELPL